MEKDNKPWWEGKPAKEMPEYIKLNGRVYPIDDAISLGKMTAECLPATKEEFKKFKKHST